MEGRDETKERKGEPSDMEGGDDTNERKGKQSNTEGGDDSDSKCRICFDEEEEEDNKFISPCRCQGSQAFVHQKCLAQWQRSVQLHRPNHPEQDSAEQRHLICNVCRQPFDVAPPSRMQMLEELSGIASSQVKPGMLLVATNCHQLPFSADIPAHWQALFEARRAHWMRAVYLICSVSGSDTAAPGDQVIGLNVTRALDEHRSSNAAQEALIALYQCRQHQAEPGGDSVCQVDMPFYVGGPVAPRVGHALCIVTNEGADAADGYDLSLVWRGQQGQALVFGKSKAVIQCATEYGRTIGDKRQVRVYQGHATWTRQQLLGEVTRGSWGLVHLEHTPLFQSHLHVLTAQANGDLRRDSIEVQTHSEHGWEAAQALDLGKGLWNSLVSSNRVRDLCEQRASNIPLHHASFVMCTLRMIRAVLVCLYDLVVPSLRGACVMCCL